MDYKVDFPEALKSLSDSSRVWIFQSDRLLNKDEVHKISMSMEQFTQGWTSHNNSLLAKAWLAFDRFIVVILDESRSAAASGCSIDKLTHQMEGLSNYVHADLLNRTNFNFMINDGVEMIPMTSLKEAVQSGQINENTLVFNNLVKTKAELSEKWLIPIKDSWQSRFM